MKWSYSALKDFLNCPRAYAETRVKKTFPKLDNPQAIQGKLIHDVLDTYIRSGERLLPPEYRAYQKFLDPLREIPGRQFTEHKLALTHSLHPCDFDHDDYWVRGIIDLLIVDNTDAYIIDYKTGNNKYADLNQLRLMALLVFHNFDVVNNIKVGLLFLTYNDFVHDEYSRSQVNQLWQTFSRDLLRLQFALEYDKWPETPNGLCKRHCPVTTCIHNGRR